MCGHYTLCEFIMRAERDEHCEVDYSCEGPAVKYAVGVNEGFVHFEPVNGPETPSVSVDQVDRPQTLVEGVGEGAFGVDEHPLELLLKTLEITHLII